MIVRVALLASAVALTAAAGAPATASPRRLAVTAFQAEYDSTSLIHRSRAAITTVGVDGVQVSSDGARVRTPSAAARKQLRAAHKDHLRAELLVSNYSDAVGDFSEPVAHRLLSSRAHRTSVAKSLARDVTRRGWDGISVDLEALTRRDAAGLTAFVRQLRRELPKRATLSICVSAATSPSEYLATGYELRKIAKVVGRVMVMAYDQHGPWEDTPGPIGSLSWQRASLKAALHSVPRRQLDLGVAGYGYAWRPHSNDTLSVAQARKLAGSRAHFDRRTGEWTATLRDGSALWWSDARSWKLRVSLAKKLHLHGLALWVLGKTDRVSV